MSSLKNINKVVNFSERSDIFIFNCYLCHIRCFACYVCSTKAGGTFLIVCLL